MGSPIPIDWYFRCNDEFHLAGILEAQVFIERDSSSCRMKLDRLRTATLEPFDNALRHLAGDTLPAVVGHHVKTDGVKRKI